MNKKIFIDCETTGKNPQKHGIIQLAAIVDIDGEIKEELNLFCVPPVGKKYDPKAAEKVPFTKKEIESFPQESELYNRFLETLNKYIDKFDKNDKLLVVGQNVQFDIRFINELFFRRNNRFLFSYLTGPFLDTLSIAAFLRDLGLLKSENLRLETVCNELGIRFKPHDAIEDVRATRNLYMKLVKIVKKEMK